MNLNLVLDRERRFGPAGLQVLLKSVCSHLKVHGDMAVSEEKRARCSGEGAGIQDLCRGLASDSGSHLELDSSLGKPGSKCLASGVRVVVGREQHGRSSESFQRLTGRPSLGRGALLGRLRCMELGRLEFSGPPNEQSLSNARRAGPLAS